MASQAESSSLGTGVPTTDIKKERRATKAPHLPASVFPPPLTIPPPSSHKQTLIILHGRGSFAARFAAPLLSTPTTTSPNQPPNTLQEVFPNAKLIFLTASRNQATIYKGKLTHQWFDHWHTTDPTSYQELMPGFLKKSVEYVHGILREAIREVEAENVVLWGLSQGGATTLSVF